MPLIETNNRGNAWCRKANDQSVRGSGSASRLENVRGRKVFDGDLLYKRSCTEVQEQEKLQQLRYCWGFLEARTLFAMLAAVKPRTMATRLIRISRAMETVEGVRSIECLMFNVEKAMACLTATSERSDSQRSRGPGIIKVPYSLLITLLIIGLLLIG